MRVNEGGLFAPDLLAEYKYFCRLFGPMPFPGFVKLSRSADELMAEALAAGYDPADVPRLFSSAALGADF